jgi:hypothetical protein
MSILNKPLLEIGIPSFLMDIGDDGISNPGVGGVGQSEGINQSSGGSVPPPPTYVPTYYILGF